jgi:hypothetical protein
MTLSFRCLASGGIGADSVPSDAAENRPIPCAGIVLTLMSTLQREQAPSQQVIFVTCIS